MLLLLDAYYFVCPACLCSFAIFSVDGCCCCWCALLLLQLMMIGRVLLILCCCCVAYFVSVVLIHLHLLLLPPTPPPPPPLPLPPVFAVFLLCVPSFCRCLLGSVCWWCVCRCHTKPHTHSRLVFLLLLLTFVSFCSVRAETLCIYLVLVYILGRNAPGLRFREATHW